MTPLLACPDCDLVLAVSDPTPGERMRCPRCHCGLLRYGVTNQTGPALAVTAGVGLLIAGLAPFIGFSRSGISDQIGLLDAVTHLWQAQQPLLSLVVCLTLVVLPALFLAGYLWLRLSLLSPTSTSWRFNRTLLRWLVAWRPWLMAEVFVIAAFVALIKLVGMAEVQLYLGFWAYALFALCLLIVLSRFQPILLWRCFAGKATHPPQAQAGQTAQAQQLQSCRRCHQLAAIGETACTRCGAPLHQRHPHSLQNTWALLIAALILSLPAQLYPIMVTTGLGGNQPATIISGVVLFAEHGDWPIALVIFIASILIPFSKIAALAWLCWVTRRRTPKRPLEQMRLYHITEFIGRWSMIDVFVVAIVVALVQLGQIMRIQPGPASLAFAAVVILTMLAAQQFDARLIWDNTAPPDEESIHS